MASSFKKKTKEKLDLLTNIDMILMLKKLSEEKHAKLYINMHKVITNTSKTQSDKDKELSYFKFW